MHSVAEIYASHPGNDEVLPISNEIAVSKTKTGNQFSSGDFVFKDHKQQEILSHSSQVKPFFSNHKDLCRDLVVAGIHTCVLNLISYNCPIQALMN